MTTRPPKRRQGPRAMLPSGPSALFIGDEAEAAALEPLFAAAQLKVNWRLTTGDAFDLEEYLLDLEEGFEGPLAQTAVAVVAADRLVDARLDVINLVDELLDVRRPMLVTCTQATLTEQAMLCQHPERVIGFGILGLLLGRNVAEITQSLRTQQRFTDQVVALFRQSGITAQLVGDCPGLVLARLLAPMVNEAALALGEKAAAASDIDRVAVLSGRVPFGPLEWADSVGLDRIMLILEHLSRSLEADRYRPAPLLKQLALSGYVGRAAGRGFFAYDAED